MPVCAVFLAVVSPSGRSKFALLACKSRVLCFQAPQTLGIASNHDAPALDSLVRHAGFTLERHPGLAAPRVCVAVEEGGGGRVSAEEGLVVFVAEMSVGFVGGGCGVVDRGADVFGVVCVVAFVVVGVEGGEGGEDGGLGGRLAAVGKQVVGVDVFVSSANVEAGCVDGEFVKLIIVEYIAAFG